MPDTHFEVRYVEFPLREPYRLSFGPVSSFRTFLVRAESSEGVGWGEITPLPGYSSETVESVLRFFGMGTNGSIDQFRERGMTGDPMATSGVMTAADTITLGADSVYSEPVAQAVPGVALCDGADLRSIREKAESLIESGFAVLKVKVGGRVDDDIRRVSEVARAVHGRGKIRVDANQRMTREDANTFADSIDGLPIELWEQPFKPEFDNEMRALGARSPVPLMLDESIWTASDIDRAADLGVSFVKLKLCKHPGIIACLDLLARSRKAGLSVVFGNGVQTHVGNRVELYTYARAQLETPIEANGFSKIAVEPDGCGLRLAQGLVKTVGATDPGYAFESGKPVAEFQLAT